MSSYAELETQTRAQCIFIAYLTRGYHKFELAAGYDFGVNIAHEPEVVEIWAGNPARFIKKL